MPLDLFNTMVQKSQKWPKTQIKGGPALRRKNFPKFNNTMSTAAIWCPII